MKKVLFLNFNCNWCPHFETELELMLKHMKEGNEVYSLSCNKIFNQHCVSNQGFGKKFCESCCYAYTKGMSAINLPEENQLKLSTLNVFGGCPKFPEFKNQKELSEYSVDGIKIGFGVVASFMSICRDYAFDTMENKKILNHYLKTAYTVAKNLEKILNELKPDAVYIFNGRFQECWPAIELCKKYNIDYYLHERGANPNKYQLVKNNLIHSHKGCSEEINLGWNSAKEPERSEIAKKWFNDRKNRVEQEWVVYTKNQQRESLPEGFDYKKNNIAIFNSSLDEYNAFSDWQNPIDNNENMIIKNIVEHYKDDDTKHFYLRIHPNLKDVKTSQLKELKAIEKLSYKNLTIIWPEEPLDSYAMIEASQKVITFISTVGVEAAFWGKPSILAGISAYDNLDCCYIAKNYEKLFELVDSDLTPKNPEHTYPYGYWVATLGIEFNYFKPEGLFNGQFLGQYIRQDTRKKTLPQKILREIKHPFKKAYNKLLKNA